MLVAETTRTVTRRQRTGGRYVEQGGWYRLDRLYHLVRLFGHLLDQALLLRRSRETTNVTGKAISPFLGPKTLLRSEVRTNAILMA